MKKGIITSIDWELIGAELANEGDENQAKFFKSLVKEMKSWETHHQLGMQLLSIRDRLTKEEREVMEYLCYEEKEQ